MLDRWRWPIIILNYVISRPVFEVFGSFSTGQNTGFAISSSSPLELYLRILGFESQFFIITWMFDWCLICPWTSLTWVSEADKYSITSGFFQNENHGKFWHFRLVYDLCICWLSGNSAYSFLEAIEKVRVGKNFSSLNSEKWKW